MVCKNEIEKNSTKILNGLRHFDENKKNQNEKIFNRKNKSSPIVTPERKRSDLNQNRLNLKTVKFA